MPVGQLVHTAGAEVFTTPVAANHPAPQMEHTDAPGVDHVPLRHGRHAGVALVAKGPAAQGAQSPTAVAPLGGYA